MQPVLRLLAPRAASSAGRSSRSPITLHGPLLSIARWAWVAIAVASLLVWIVETPLLYHAALRLQNTNGMFTLQPAEWARGLHQLGLSRAAYAAISIAGLFVMTATMFLVGTVIFLRRSSEWIGLLVSYTFVNLGVGIINAYAGGPAVVAAHPELAQPLSLYMLVTSPTFYALFLIPLIFPDGRLVPRWMWLLVPAVIFDFLPVSVPGWLSTALQVIVFVTVLLSPIYRYWRISDSGQREQTKWVLFGLVIALGAFFSLGLIKALIPGLTSTPGHTVLLALVGGTVVYLALSFLPVSFAVAILRYRLWEIDVLINRALVYGSLTASIVALYAGGVLGLQKIFQSVTGQSSDLAVAIATLAVAALFNPWRHRLQAFIDRRFYRRKYDAARTLASFTGRLRDEVDLDQLTGDLAEVVNDTVQPASISLWLRPGGQNI
jgi:hypothetical protein